MRERPGGAWLAADAAAAAGIRDAATAAAVFLGQQQPARAAVRTHPAARSIAAATVSAADIRLQMSALRDKLPANRRKQNLAGWMGGLRPPALLLFPALLDRPPDETGDAHLPDVPRDFIRQKAKRR